MSKHLGAVREQYTAEEVRRSVAADFDRLFAPYVAGRSPTWSCNILTKELISTGNWLNEQLALACNEKDRITQIWKYNRRSRTYDIFESAAECMNDVLNGTVEQNHKPVRRWG